MNNATRDFTTKKMLHGARYHDTTHSQMWSVPRAGSGAQFITDFECEHCATHQLVPLHVAFPANYNRNIEFRSRYGVSCCIAGGKDSQIAICDDASLGKVI